MSNAGKDISSSSREIKVKVYLYMKKEKENAASVMHFNNVYERVIAATGVSLSSLKRIIKEVQQKEDTEKFSSPRKKFKKPSPKSNVDQWDKEIIRTTIYRFTNTHSRQPTTKAVMEAVQEAGVDYSGKLSTFRNVIKNLGFRWKKTENNRRILMEKRDIRLKRIEYLRKIKKYREEGRNILYCDETYIHQSHTKSKVWTDGSINCGRASIGKGQRIIIVHCGGSQGFVENALLMFTSGAKSGEYHNDMNHANFKKWLQEKLLPNIPENSVLVVDNASYHNVVEDPAPISTSRKVEMRKWLNERNILFNNYDTQVELFQQIKRHKPAHNKYVIDSMLAEKGCTVLRLPRYHPELNPIENIWGIVKSRVAARNTTNKLCDVKKLAEEEFQAVTAEVWQKTCARVERTEENFISSEVFLDEVTEFIITGSDSNSEFWSTDDDTDEN